MSNIGSDNSRFKDIIRGKIKDNLKELVSKEFLIGQQGGRPIKIPITNIDIPRFRFGQNGGTSMGNGKIGDPIDGSGKGKDGSGKAGNEEGEHDFNAEFEPEELADILREHLQLPRLEPKAKGDISTEKTKYNSIANVGNEGLRHNKRTYKEALKRELSSGTYNPDRPMIIPDRNDKRYKSSSTTITPDIKASATYIIDCSGSMGDDQRHIVKSQVFWIDLLLRSAYPKIESAFIVHDMKAQEVSRDDFFRISSSGGTLISSGLNMYVELLEKRFDPSSYCNYVFDFSDGDNYNDADNYDCGVILRDKILPNCNQFAYGQVQSPGGSGDFLEFMKVNFGNLENVVITHIENANDVLKSIKAFFERGK